MRVISTEIEISASDEEVWQVLSDFDAYPEWNPFIKTIEGKLEAYPQGNNGIETLQIGGHNLLGELYRSLNKYIYLEIEYIGNDPE